MAEAAQASEAQDQLQFTSAVSLATTQAPANHEVQCSKTYVFFKKYILNFKQVLRIVSTTLMSFETVGLADRTSRGGVR